MRNRQLRGKKKAAIPVVLWILGLVAGILWIFPFYWMLATSLKPESSILTSVSLVPEVFTFEHYVTVFTKAPLLRWIANSVIVAVTVTVARLGVSSLAGYAIARMKFVGRDLVFLLLLGSMMIPDEITVVPLFIWVLKLKLADSYWALIVPQLAGAFSVLFYRQYFLTFPRDLEDAAAMDGCSSFQTFRHVVFPLAKSATTACTIIVFSFVWNDYLWPMLVSFKEEWMTLPVGAAIFNPVGFQQTGNKFGYGTAMAVIVVAALPTLAFFLGLQRYFIQGITREGLKG
ncbi:MAG: carbohydrate ABC transporter permease [Spirochaetes bacterium]|nr:carbohydrate ABC transporter permease [Spirochaetota bacterium]